MAHNQGDDETTERSLELPSLTPRGARRRKGKRSAGRRVAGRETTPSDAADAEGHAAGSDRQPEPERFMPPPPSSTPSQPTQAEPTPSYTTSEYSTHVADGFLDSTPADPAPANGTRRGASSAGERDGRPARQGPAPLATVPTGLLVGGIGTGLTYLGLRGCEVLTGTDSCGGGQGLLLLVAILALMVLVGAGLLKAFRVPDAGSTSFLAVGIVTVLVMLALLDFVFSVWMFGVMPALAAVAYPVARWVTSRFVEERGAPEAHDVR